MATLSLIATAVSACAMQPSDRAFIDAALDQWLSVERDWLGLEPQQLPTIVTADASCVYRLTPGAAGWESEAHDGTFTIPDGAEIPVGVMSFAGGTDQPFFVMTLPSVWREGGVESELGLEGLMTGVLFHEMMHSYQTVAIGRALNDLGERLGLGENFSDDSLQEHFSDNASYVAAYEAERDTLYEAAAEPDRVRAASLFRQGLAMMDARRRHFFTGENATWAEPDRVFLAMEGLGQYLVYRSALAQLGKEHGETSDPEALAATRRDSRWWTQDQGLALFLLIDRFHPDWREGGAALDPTRLDRLLAESLEAALSR